MREMREREMRERGREKEGKTISLPNTLFHEEMSMDTLIKTCHRLDNAQKTRVLLEVLQAWNDYRGILWFEPRNVQAARHELHARGIVNANGEVVVDLRTVDLEFRSGSLHPIGKENSTKMA